MQYQSSCGTRCSPVFCQETDGTTENNGKQHADGQVFGDINPGLSHVPNLLDFISMEVPSFVVIDHYFFGATKNYSEGL